MLDVGSPFDYRRQAILYVARHLPPPGRDGLTGEFLDELAELIEAAGGRTLGLFSSQRAAEQAAAAMRPRCDVPVLCQGDDATPSWSGSSPPTRRPACSGRCRCGRASTCPGAACQLVVIDRIPFPRPDDPLVTARQDAAGRGNGFMTVSAAAAALLLAQGAGRLIRSGDRPRRGRGPRLAAGHRALRRVPAAVAAAVLDDGGPRPGAPVAASPRRQLQGRRPGIAGR